MLRAMLRSVRILILSLLVLAPAAAWAQMAQGPPTPLAVDLAKVPVGSWAKYSMTMGQMPPMSMKMALVARPAAGNTLEMSVEGGMAAKVGTVVTQMTLAPGAEGTVQRPILQAGKNDP